MTVRDLTTLKSYFETGDKPTQSQFADFIDTSFKMNVINFSSYLSSAFSSGTNYDAQINQAILDCYNAGGGTVFLDRPGTYVANQITHYRGVLLEGFNPYATILKQAPGLNQDFIVSENFSSLTGSNKTVSGDNTGNRSPLVPSWFGIGNMKVAGEKTVSVSGRAIAYYGCAIRFKGTVIVSGAAQDNIYTEYANTSGSLTSLGQEEGFFDHIVSRNPGGRGWHFRGPHDSYMIDYTGCYCGDWGMYTEADGSTYNGAFGWIGNIHTYANTGDKGQYYGAGAHVARSQCDGDNLVINCTANPGSRVVMSDYFGFIAGQSMPGVTLANDGHQFGQMIITMASNASASTALLVRGNNNTIGKLYITTDNNANNGVIVSGGNNIINGIHISDFSTNGYDAIRNHGNFNSYRGFIQNCKNGFNYVAGGNLTADLFVYTNTGQVPVSGFSPGAGDRFDIRGGGTVTGGTRVQVVTTAGNNVNLNSTAVQTITLPHNCLYTPQNQNVVLSVTASADDYAWAFPPTLVSAGSSNLTIKCKLATATSAAASANVVAHIRM